ncbi:MAG: HD domain-containing protein [Lachnospiraceae bacterium]|nr:HD domain-containing protein [Lachnospiraceae bacterium]MBP5472757.1 HD domain-containing protein [Lachnospiraceae bacterium]
MIADSEVKEILSDYISDSKVQEMKRYIQHGCVSTFEHCNNVAEFSYKIDKKLSLHSDLNVLLVGALLHDFYLYDWHDHKKEERLPHGFTHARDACRNAGKYFDLDDRTKRVISCHMWPLTLRSLPKAKEEWIVCLADKCVSLQETLFARHR